MDFDPGLHHARLAVGQASIEQIAGFDSENRFIAGIVGVKVRQIVLARIFPVKIDQDSVERADKWHGHSFRERASFKTY